MRLLVTALAQASAPSGLSLHWPEPAQTRQSGPLLFGNSFGRSRVFAALPET